MPASIAAIKENMNAGITGSLIKNIKSETPNPNAAANNVEKAIMPK